jgi:hypothetical protein
MPEERESLIIPSVKIPPSTKDKYGKDIDDLKVDQGGIPILSEDRVKVYLFTKNKYKKKRTYVTRKIGVQVYLFRTK